MKKKIAILAVFGLLNAGIGASHAFAGWDDDVCKDKDKILPCCPACSFWCGCTA